MGINMVMADISIKMETFMLDIGNTVNMMVKVNTSNSMEWNNKGFTQKERYRILLIIINL